MTCQPFHWGQQSRHPQGPFGIEMNITKGVTAWLSGQANSYQMHGSQGIQNIMVQKMEGRGGEQKAGGKRRVFFRHGAHFPTLHHDPHTNNVLRAGVPVLVLIP